MRKHFQVCSAVLCRQSQPHTAACDLYSSHGEISGFSRCPLVSWRYEQALVKPSFETGEMAQQVEYLPYV